MNKENKPRFSHITIGKDYQSNKQEEEIITIGALDANCDGCGDLHKPSKLVQLNGPLAPLDLNTDKAPSGFEKESKGRQDFAVSGASDKENARRELDVSMPTLQKVILIGCALTFVVVIVLITVFWLQ